MTRVVLAEHGHQRMRLVLALDSYKGNRYLDVREYYKKGDDWVPGRKGITLNRDRLSLVLDVLANQHEQVFDYLGSTYVPTTVRKGAEARASALEALRYSLGKVETRDHQDGRDPRLFDVRAHGGTTHVLLNSVHPLGRRLHEGGGLGQLLAAYAQARDELAHSPSTKALFEQLEYLWARFARGDGDHDVEVVEDLVDPGAPG